MPNYINSYLSITANTVPSYYFTAYDHNTGHVTVIQPSQPQMYQNLTAALDAHLTETHNPEQWVNPYRFARIARPEPQYDNRYHGHIMWRNIECMLGTIRKFADSLYFRSVDDKYESETTKQYPTEHLQQHSWHAALQSKHQFHSAVRDAVLNYPPADWHQLTLEYPHTSTTNPSMIAYTRSEDHGNADRQTITSVGKYLRRHFPSMPDHVLRDYVMRYGEHTFAMWDTIDRIIKSVQDGPSSCMQWRGRDEGDSDDHPYNAYDPKFGWRAAVRLNGEGQIVGRCLVNVYDEPIFVRSYAHKQDGYSHSDEALEVWLRDQGFRRADSWEGCKLALIPQDRSFLAPYLDGNIKTVSRMSDHLLVDEDGEWTCESTNGYPTEHDSFCCPDCDEHVDEDDTVSTGYHGDHTVCRGCADYNYILVIGRNGSEYYVHQDNATYVESQEQYYDDDYLDRNGIIQLDDGEYEHIDYAVHLEYSDMWVAQDDDRAVYTVDDQYEHIDDCVLLHNGDYALRDDAWQCDINGEWYHDDELDQRIEFCSLTTQSILQAHEDNIEDEFGADLDAGAEYCEAILEQQTI